MTASVEFEFVNNPGRIAMVDNFTTTGGNIIVLATGAGGGTSLINGRFNFIAIGVR